MAAEVLNSDCGEQKQPCIREMKKKEAEWERKKTVSSYTTKGYS